MINENLQATRATLEGHRQHNSTTEETFECLQTQRTPVQWVKYAYPCHSDIATFMENLRQRVDYIKELVEQFKSKNATQRRFWMPGFFN